MSLSSFRQKDRWNTCYEDDMFTVFDMVTDLNVMCYMNVDVIVFVDKLIPWHASLKTQKQGEQFSF